MYRNNYKFTLPYPPDSLNKVMKFGKKEGDIVKIKHKWERLSILYINQAINSNMLPRQFTGKIGVHFKLYFKTSRERDGDNYASMCKGILDAFVKEGMIRDDSQQYVNDNGRRLILDRDRPRVDVYITEEVDDDDVVEIKPLVEINYEQRSSSN